MPRFSASLNTRSPHRRTQGWHSQPGAESCLRCAPSPRTGSRKPSATVILHPILGSQETGCASAILVSSRGPLLSQMLATRVNRGGNGEPHNTRGPYGELGHHSCRRPPLIPTPNMSMPWQPARPVLLYAISSPLVPWLPTTRGVAG